MRSSALLVAFLVATAALAIPLAAGTSEADIAFPIPELGNCADKAACLKHCDLPANEDACRAFAQKHGLGASATPEQGIQYPVAALGGCADEKACRAYCQDVSRREACLKFAEEHKLMDSAELQRARTATEQLAQGKGPGGCTSEESCKAYCKDDAHLTECLGFAEKNGFITKEQADMARKMGSTKGPGGCDSQQACEAFCGTRENMKACIEFAEAHGMMGAEELAQAKRVLAAGGPPPGCKDKASCDAYCKEPAHQAECIEFAHKAGMMADKDYEMAKKMAASGGPGGCRDEQTCRAYCEQEAHGQECAEFFGDGDASQVPNAPQACKDKGYTIRQCMDYCEGGGDCGGMGGPGGAGSCGGSAGYSNPGCEGIPQACKDKGYDGNQCNEHCSQNPSTQGCNSGGTDTFTGGPTSGGPGGCGGTNGYPSPQCDGIPPACREKGYDGNQCQTYCQQDPSACGQGNTQQSGGPTSGQSTSGGPSGSGNCGGASGYPSPQCDGIPPACREKGYDGNQCQQYCSQNPSACGQGNTQSGGPTSGQPTSGGPGGCGGTNGYPSPECDGIPQACRDRGYDGNQCQAYCQQNPSSCSAGLVRRGRRRPPTAALRLGSTPAGTAGAGARVLPETTGQDLP